MVRKTKNITCPVLAKKKKNKATDMRHWSGQRCTGLKQMNSTHENGVSPSEINLTPSSCESIQVLTLVHRLRLKLLGGEKLHM